MHRLPLLLLLLAPLAAHAGDIRISVHIPGWWPLWVLEQPRQPPVPSRHHLGAPAQPAKDSCTFVAGVRHCPRAEPK